MQYSKRILGSRFEILVFVGLIHVKIVKLMQDENH